MQVLIADDDNVSRRILETMLRSWDYDVIAVSDGAGAWKCLQQPRAPRLAILDWMMPGMTGPAICNLLRLSRKERYTYVLLLTARTERQDVIEGMESGADDYITKPFDAQELKVRLRAGRRILDLEAELLAAREALREQATRDPLTCVWNRYAILEALARELIRAGREGTDVAVMMADLDHFKHINDLCGHLAGDDVLRETARRMQACVRPYDQVGRYGGEEFLILSPGSSIVNARRLAERIRAAVGNEPVAVGGQKIELTVSIGLTTAGGGAFAPEDLIRAADEALYRAKERGRNRVEEGYPAAADPLNALATALASAPPRSG